MHIVCVEAGVREACTNETSRRALEQICMQLPEDDCLPLGTNPYGCREDEFDCGDGQCVHGLQLCDHKFDCKSGADELKWLVSATI